MAHIKSLRKIKVKFDKRIFTALFVCCLLFAVTHFLTGCATAPSRDTIAGYDINGVRYLPLITLCNLRGIEWEYDTFTRSVTLSKDAHKVNLRVGDALILVDGNPVHLRHPVDIYQGVVAVPDKFREQVLDALFKQAPAGRKAVLPVSIIKKIVVDAGHGGHDPGTIGTTGIKEKYINLDIAKRVTNLLRAEGIEVVMTRSTDVFIALDRRVEIANDSGADLFISIHSNANRVRSLHGFEVYYVASSVSDTKRALEAAKNDKLKLENASFASSDLDLKAIVWDMIYTYSRGESIELSRSLCRIVDNNLDCRIIGVKGARFAVLRGAQMPAVLIEMGFLSNPAEEAKLKNGFYRQRMAEAIVEGVKDYSKQLILTEVR